ncbi:hypothetical protein HIM_04138 [Hirsutella minnesotensis 3608]|uniref:Heme haloperoxidase family profile domain-containing protein n=1 Tax=Hirsutella minnesotensis 3608 TaxID=1043627 RepID=A0A0F8A639_9HYPO|nr:hypothetical protein HIM_04138 [Hirsutella minnesotensis 3608]
MRGRLSSAIFLIIATLAQSGESAIPKLNLGDPRFQQWMPAGPNDTRSACPGLNTLANHGFLPRNGRKVNATTIIQGCFQGMGMSPDTCSIIVLDGLVEASLPMDLVFDLSDVNRPSWKIEHDGSFSRQDVSENGSYPQFDKEVWAATLQALTQCSGSAGFITTQCLGLARAATITEARRRNPKSVYDMKAASHGAVEAARIQLVLGTSTGADISYFSSIFEQERLPVHLGWMPRPLVAGMDEMLDVAVQIQASSPLLQNTSDGTIATRHDLLEVLSVKNLDFEQDVLALVDKAGFSKDFFMPEVSTLMHDAVVPPIVTPTIVAPPIVITPIVITHTIAPPIVAPPVVAPPVVAPPIQVHTSAPPPVQFVQRRPQPQPQQYVWYRGAWIPTIYLNWYRGLYGRWF